MSVEDPPSGSSGALDGADYRTTGSEGKDGVDFVGVDSSPYSDQEEDDTGLVIQVPSSKEKEEERREMSEGRDEDGREHNGGRDREGPPLKTINRIPTLVCDEHEEVENESPRRASRLSKQCVVDEDPNIVQPAACQLCIVVDTRGEQLRNESGCPSSSSSLTGPQWAEVTDRRRFLANQLLGRTPIALSQSEGNLGNKSFPVSSKNTKQLVRSHALCGDDDTRLRPPPEFARSNPTFLNTTKSLSRDSSTTDYTDSSGVDLYSFIIATLHKNPKDRSMLLDLEKQLVVFVEDKTKQSMKFAPMSSYNRMLVHRVAAYFGLDHNIDQSGQCIVVNKTDTTRIPEHEFVALIQGDVYTDMRKSLSRDAQSYEEIRDYPSLPREPVDHLSRRTRSFEVGGMESAVPVAPSYMAASTPTPLTYCSTEEIIAPPEEAPIGPKATLEAPDSGRRKEKSLGPKSGSFGGVPVYYRTNSNGVRPVEEMRGKNAGGTARVYRSIDKNNMAHSEDFDLGGRDSGGSQMLSSGMPYAEPSFYRVQPDYQPQPQQRYMYVDQCQMYSPYAQPVPPMRPVYGNGTPVRQSPYGGQFYGQPMVVPMYPSQPEPLMQEMSAMSVSGQRLPRMNADPQQPPMGYQQPAQPAMVPPTYYPVRYPNYSTPAYDPYTGQPQRVYYAPAVTQPMQYQTGYQPVYGMAPSMAPPAAAPQQVPLQPYYYAQPQSYVMQPSTQSQHYYQQHSADAGYGSMTQESVKDPENVEA